MVRSRIPAATPSGNAEYAHIVARSRIPIVEAQVDAIVNAANTNLAEGAEVCGAIFRATGSAELTASCRALGGCATGEAKVTIHAVGSRGSDRPDLLASCYRQSLIALSRRGLRTIAFSCIITGVYAFDFKQATDIARRTVVEWLE